MPRLRDDKENLASSYLREHADNPVDWWAWGADAFEHARERGVPVFVSIGYSSCHWCHVMEHESFQDPQVAELLNAEFVSIKVDREERPDVDSLYMTATQLSSGHGGWPMSVFALADGRPFFTGTYFPPVDHANQAGFPRVVRALANAWRVQPDAVREQAQEIAEALAREVAFVDQLVAFEERLDLGEITSRLHHELLETLDADGGFEVAPKFPHFGLLNALVGTSDELEAALTLCLDAMARRGLYDHLGGGFARYCVDRAWHVPHFEKMLVDQANLIRLYTRAARDHGRVEWHDVARATARFVLEEMSVSRGIGASFDADAAGHEGAHVTWTPDEVIDALGSKQESEAALRRWTITPDGDLEGRSVPRLSEDEAFTTPPALRDAEASLRAARAMRPQPARDDKVILEWNASFAASCLLLGEEFSEAGLELLTNLESTHQRDGAWWRTQNASARAALADLAALLDAQLDAFEHTGETAWLKRAEASADYLMLHFWDGPRPTSLQPDVGQGLFSASDEAADLLMRPKEIFDGVGPSGNSLATRGVARLGLITADQDYLAIARRLVTLAAPLLRQHPRSVPDLLDAARFAFEGVEIVIPGPANELSQHVRLRPVPRAVLITGEGPLALLEQRRAGLAYVCHAGVCRQPVSSVEELDRQLDELGV